MASIASCLQRIKDDPLGVLGRRQVEQVCREHHVSWRDRQLDPATTVALFIQQVLHGNAPCSEVRHIAAGTEGLQRSGSFTPQAYCAARARLPLAVYQTLLNEVYERMVPQTWRQEHLWHGHRTFHIGRSRRGQSPMTWVTSAQARPTRAAGMVHAMLRGQIVRIPWSAFTWRMVSHRIRHSASCARAVVPAMAPSIQSWSLGELNP